MTLTWMMIPKIPMMPCGVKVLIMVLILDYGIILMVHNYLCLMETLILQMHHVQFSLRGPQVRLHLLEMEDCQVMMVCTPVSFLIRKE